MSSLLLIFVCSLVINSQARTLTENRDHQLGLPTRVADYNGPVISKPGFIEMIESYGRDEHEFAPPSPKEAPPTHQVSAAAEENEVWKLKMYGRDKPKRAPPAPKEAPPTHQVGKEGGEVVPPPPHHAPPTHQENYGKEGGHPAPPPPHHAPPTHQVSGTGGEESWAVYVLLSASA
ncbi:hypothetical protein SASPL_125966 [Salvia splendens]|uniref:Uncharacterized protein n=1 Tax=Salvia splendens TaxID=180675 RepID=A0A8X8XGT9_SALSN|nr:early nodulin-75-like [Salvia splendens]KAG6413258.1 hypothetical protein SASPL_125966 [Salvia splendens]